MAQIQLRNLVKSFGSVQVVKGVNLEIKDQELVVLVGPSGCGKTTTLRMIAGLETPTSGEIIIGGQLANRMPPAVRNVAMVFQNFALYPHMTGRQIMSLPLEVRKVTPAKIKERIEWAAQMMSIEHLLDRKPEEMSGGEKQRVAVGRAIVRDPAVLLMDEPLSNLDAKLRLQMRSELRKLSRNLGATTVYVTHDQVEAMTMGDRLVVFSNGVIQQADTPRNVYNNPANMFVAGLIGSPPMNFVQADAAEVGEQLTIRFGNTEIPLLPRHRQDFRTAQGRTEVVAGIRPGHLRLTAPGAPDAHVNGEVEVVEPQGAETYVHVRFPGGRLVVEADADLEMAEGSTVGVHCNIDRMCLFDRQTEMRIA